jgi:hypothetical protein
VEEVTGPALRSMADRGGEAMTEIARERTPLGPGKDYGHVRESWRRKPVTRESRPGGAGYASGVESDHYRARWVEWGVGPHNIDPKDAEAIQTPEGPRAAAHHPGYAGAHPVAQAAAAVDAGFGGLMRPEAQAWAREAEANAKRRLAAAAPRHPL